MQKTGAEWTTSREKRVVDIGFATVSSPVNAAASLLRPDRRQRSKGLLKGELSVVGVRQLGEGGREEILDVLSPQEQIEWTRARTLCKPGVIDGFDIQRRVYEYEPDPWASAAEDIYYLQNASRLHDARLVLDRMLLVAGSVMDMDISTRSGCSQTTEIFSDLAQSFGVDVNERDIEYWQAMLTVALALDTIVDDDKSRDIAPHLNRLYEGQPISGVDLHEAAAFSSVYEGLSSERRAAIDNGTSLADYAKEQQYETDAVKLVDIRRRESAVFARIMHLDIAENAPDAAAREKFNEWLLMFGRAGYLLDTLVDLRHDYQNGEIAVRPSVASGRIIALETVSEIWTTFREMPKKALPKLAISGLSKTIRGTLASRVPNRLANEAEPVVS